MITKEERAEVKNALYDHNNTLYQTLTGYWLRQYEDTVTELEKRLNSVTSEVEEMKELMDAWNFKNIARGELEGYEQAVLLELVERCESIISQLEKGDKEQ